MKKIFIVVALFTLLMSCKDKKKEKKKTEETTAVPATNSPDPVVQTLSTPGVPTFSDPEVQKAANEFSVIWAEFSELRKDTAKKKDTARQAESLKKISDWGKKNKNILLKLTGTSEDAEKWRKWDISLRPKVN